MVKISADSTCDLSPELVKRYHVVINPLYINNEQGSYQDGVDITPEDIFVYFEQTGKLFTTSAASVSDYTTLFESLTADGSELVHITISAEMSSCYQNACIAAQEVGNVYVVDSKNLSTGMGHIVIEAAILAQKGASGEEIKREMDALTPYVDASFVLEKLNYLYKGGRCSAVASLGANLLKLKPCIEVKDGKMGVGKKYRGSLEKVLLEYVKDRLYGKEDICADRIFVTHCGCDRKIVDPVKKEVASCMDFEEMLETTAGCTVSSHCGPHTLGILYIRKKEM